MEGKSDAASHEEYIQRLAEPRRSEVRAVHELIRRAVPQLEQTMESATWTRTCSPSCCARRSS